MVDAQQPGDPKRPGPGQARWPFTPGGDGCGQAPRLVHRGEAKPLVEGFQQAEELAEWVWAVFERAGLGEAVTVTPGLEEESGRPCVYVWLDGHGRTPEWFVLVPATAQRVSVRVCWQRRPA